MGKLLAALVFLGLLPLHAAASQLTNWIERCDQIAASTRGAETSLRFECRTMVAVSMFDALNAIEGAFTPYQYKGPRVPDADRETAMAFAAHTTLSRLFPDQKIQADAMSAEADAIVASLDARNKGAALGKRVADELFELRSKLSADIRNDFRPRTEPGVWTATELPLGTRHVLMKPWAIGSVQGYMPGVPPKLTSTVWARDFNEVKALGALHSTSRTPQQTAAAEFWNSDYSYDEVFRQATSEPGRSLLRNARLLALYHVTNHDTFLVGIIAKYKYRFWRPVTAIRNGDRDNNPATQRDPFWEPLAPTPAHPEYPCGHCREGAVVKEVLSAEFGEGLRQSITVTSVQKPARTFNTFADVSREESASRIWLGVHFTNTAKASNEFVARAAADIRSRLFRPIEGR